MRSENLGQKLPDLLHSDDIAAPTDELPKIQEDMVPDSIDKPEEPKPASLPKLMEKDDIVPPGEKSPFPPIESDGNVVKLDDYREKE